MLKSGVTGCWGDLFQNFCETATLISTVAYKVGSIGV